MNAYKVTLLIINHDQLDSDDVIDILECTKYPNYCISPTVVNISEREIGSWEDDHPLNGPHNVMMAEFEKIFGENK